jgi:hypothetical protein
MKPGDGKTHKACATLCIRGGIPPMFASPQPGGQTRQYLIVKANGEPLDSTTLEAILPYVADPVEVTGTVELQAGRWLLRLNPADIRRL